LMICMGWAARLCSIYRGIIVAVFTA